MTEPYPPFPESDLERLEGIIDKAAALRAPPTVSDVRVHGTQEAIDKFMTEMALARLEFGVIAKSRTAKVVTRDRGTYEYSWAPLLNVLEAVVKPLAQHGVTIWQPWSGPDDQGRYRITTWVRGHGACVEAVAEFHGAGNDQDRGKQITYVRRYSLNAILSVDADPDVDDDGVDEREPKAPPQNQPQKRPPALEGGRVEKPSQGQQRPAARQERPRSEPPPKPAQRPAGSFAERLAQNRGKPTDAQQRELDAAEYQASKAARGESNPFERGDAWEPPDSMDDAPRDTTPAPPPKPTPAHEESELPKDRIDELHRLAKLLDLKGPKFVSWMEKRINKSDPKSVDARDLEFLIEAANEELSARAAS